MAARPRIRIRANWPEHLHEPRPGYFTWFDPRTKKTHILGRMPLAQAIYEATEANMSIAAGKKALAERVESDSPTFSELLKKMPISEKYNTAQSRRLADSRLEAKIGKVKCRELTTKHFADIIEAILSEGKVAMAKVVRARAMAVCRRGVSLGWMDSNPAAITEGVKFKTKRSRLTLEAFQKILEQAPRVTSWLENAMLLALVSGQDRSTCARWERSWVKQGHAVVTRQKTGVAVEIPTSLRLDAIDLTLADVIARCKKTGVLSQYLIHYTSTKNGTVPGAPVKLAVISAAFARARRKAKIADENAPSFHEIRSLSKRLYDKQGGVDTKALLGHMSDTSAETYADARGIEPIRVKLGS
ncbi:phage integrase Arm DNA-binding domain-containing protein [Burkholderia vietnamiensis]|uniref:tyrosine-type recombinase/integrase n=1 Tax=Burkholderia vietnamiensis TaxID=60552 RepID=UPI00159431E7|nr:tyrosine-type recombinase/integrase [Burkholderia vietnamiensis]WHU91001.1 phage integrase Arm DNA-binding domain-containing protein [Burkholderia vietnamiensis]